MKKILASIIFATAIINSTIISSVQANNSSPSTSSISSPNPKLIARKDDKPKKTVQHTKISSDLVNFRTQKIQVGTKTLSVGRNEIRSIYGKHHPKYYTGRSKDKETFLDRRTKPADTIAAMRSILGRNRNAVSNGITPVTGTYKGKKYEVGFNSKKGRVRHFVPK
ncbi:hypothetical protein [Chamaesiphon sp. GL140_3_metabinner_50]|uniref:hypothetical protein n=1 Tax=Chamaesiphon sp. GL140_3_metabinner_50 TaxID=2970812 RepID=UPI0025F94251|nr:hypothetical protein [Chamaesiphon sp. GL140_3_metabinner_50]